MSPGTVRGNASGGPRRCGGVGEAGGPSGAFGEEGQAQTWGCIARRATKRGPPSEDAEAGHDAPQRGGAYVAPAAGGEEFLEGTSPFLANSRELDIPGK